MSLNSCLLCAETAHSQTVKRRKRRAPLLKKILRFVEEALAKRAFLSVAKVGEFLKLGFLRGGQVRRHFDVYANVQVAVAVALNVFNAFSFQAEHRARLCAGRNLNRSLPLQGRDVYFRP